MVKLMNKGYTLLEVLLVMFTLTMLSSLFFVVFKRPSYTYINPVACQLDAFSNHSRCYFTKDIWFNQNGNINKARSVKLGKFDCVFQLGFGRFRCE